ncbi:hypothetical protein NPA07_04920 [Mycoplasmopsis caviae]|uniref:Lipoprotein n=1 Tax=Mycoplasmopsis caviae TaxID=55603 RepID=A0A3P8L7B1_9BACT|nr:hypothetical protein [Mycoplasmopsis caviae]UUD35118.1 hypothetical protein NPA07_04920 [Mycoplasmopsis caviae]VDR42065.1 Uncharacterised protein [Mycoplasmopsis caviae]
MPKWKKITFLMPTSLFISAPIISASCQSSFWDIGEYEKNVYETRLKELVNNYNDNFDKLAKFMDQNNRSGSYKTHYYEDFEKARKITKFAFDDFILKYSSAINVKDGKKSYKFVVNGIDQSNEFDQYYRDFSSKTNSSNKETFYNNVTYLRKINEEINSIFDDWSNYIRNNSSLLLFGQIFTNNKFAGWPFFYNRSNSEWYQKQFFGDIAKHNENIAKEYITRYFDKDKSNIDYSLIKNPSESDGKHTHAVMNLLNEWISTVISPTDKNNRINKIIKWIEEFKTFIMNKSWEFKKGNILLKFKSQSKFEDIDLFDFINELENNINISKLPYEKDITAKIKQEFYKNRFLKTIDKLVEIANEILFLVRQYES